MLMIKYVTLASAVLVGGMSVQDFPNYSVCMNYCLQKFSSDLGACQVKPLSERQVCESRARADYEACSFKCRSIPYP